MTESIWCTLLGVLHIQVLNTLFVSLTVNWCQHWFEYFPNPPINILGMVENVLAYHDRRLLEHLVACDVTSQVQKQECKYEYQVLI